MIDPRLEPARDIVFATNDGRGADVVVVATPYRTDWDLAFDLCAKGGHLHLAVPPRDDWRWSVPPGRLFADELRVTAGGPAAPTEIQAVLDLLTGARFDANDLITHRFGLAEIEAAFELEQAADASLKAVVFPASNHLASTEVLYDAVI
ncbi:MAG TPA: hypothetical protein PK954_06725 [Anaerolineales bacterium]|nr:hypothetical protein [Anaerolineales bacterium]